MRAILVTAVGLLSVGCGTPPYDQPPPENPDVVGTAPPPDCTDVTWEDVQYDCTQLDRCTEQDFGYRLACCDCDPALCNPDPDCEDPEAPERPLGEAESCMRCHNGSNADDYAGPGMSNPHPFGPATYIKCTTCHGGDGLGQGRQGSHVPPPPSIGNELNLQQDEEAYFNYLTRTGLDKLPNYTVGDTTYSALDYLQFMNPGDFRVVTQGRGCGNSGCHSEEHAKWVPISPLGSDRFFSTTMYSVGVQNPVAAQRGIYYNTAASYAWREQEDPSWVYNPDQVGRVGRLEEIETGIANYGELGGLFQSNTYTAAAMNDQLYANQNVGGIQTYANQVENGSPLHDVLMEAVVGGCADCHAYSSGANNRYADFRSSGCTACHMEYSFDGKSRSTDPNVNKIEPADPDAIAAPERPHIQDHQIRNIARILPNGAFVRGQSDKVCVGCHQGSNRTVLQFWGIRLDQNRDLDQGFQYPDNPETFTDTTGYAKLFDPAVNNNTFNGRDAQQLILEEDYDGDTRDDTPPDVHHEAGMGCIDCHGSQDVHSGTEGGPINGYIMSHQTEVVGVTCKSCHGDDRDYAGSTECRDYTGTTRQCLTDRFGNPMRNTYVDGEGDRWLVSRVNQVRHYIPQTKDTIDPTSTVVHPDTSLSLYSPNASYAMGRVDGNAANGVGPQQTNYAPSFGFSHMDNVSCEGCHAAWTNSCIGCHLQGVYDADPQNYFFNNVDGSRVAYTFNADFTYISPALFNLAVTVRDEVGSSQPGMKMFFRYQDLNGDETDVFAFSDLNGNGNNPDYQGRGPFGSLSHNRIFPHSIRGRVTPNYEGVAYCVKCHLNEEQLAEFDANGEYTAFFDGYNNTPVAADRQAFYADLDYNLLQEHIGRNTGNQLNSPYYVHMAAGLGSGLFQFDETGCPNNPLDANANREYCPNGAPAANFDAANTVYDLDRIVELSGVSNSSLTHPMVEDNNLSLYPNRNGARVQRLSGPMGSDLLRFLASPAEGLVLDSWLDADGVPQGDAEDYINQ